MTGIEIFILAIGVVSLTNVALSTYSIINDRYVQTTRTGTVFSLLMSSAWAALAFTILYA